MWPGRYQDAAAVTLNDSTEVGFKALYIMTAGTLRVTTEKGNVVNFGAVVAGSIIPLSVTKCHSTGTTCTVLGLK